MGLSCNQAVFSGLVGISQQAVSKLIKKGILKDKDILSDWLLDYCENLRGQAAGRSGDAQAKLTEARTRDAIASAKIKEAQFLETCGALVAVADIQPLLENWATVSRSEVANALNKIIGDIQGQHDITINPDIASNHMNAAYEIIGNWPSKNNEAEE